jgi:hypothetical protein
MDTSRSTLFNAFLIAAPLAFVPVSGALADDRTKADEDSPAVVTLKSSLSSTRGFEVEDVRMTDSGVACIKYRVPNDSGGETHAQAVVEGEKVLRSTTRSTQFAKAWNSKCAGADGS